MADPPDLVGVVAAFRAARARHVVIGGFAVIAHEFVRATEDSDLLIPDDAANDLCVIDALRALGAVDVTAERLAAREHLRVVAGGHGIVDLLRGGEPPLDFASVDADAIEAEVRGVPIRFAGLASVVAFKRLANRVKDRLDLEALTEIHGDLPRLHIPGLDG